MQPSATTWPAHVNYRRRLAALWRQAQHRPSPLLRGLLSTLRLPHDFSEDRWGAGPAKFLGGELCSTIEEAFHPGSMQRDRLVPRCTSDSRIFKGGKWTEALAIPFFANPGRICAFAFIGRQGDMRRTTYSATPASL